MKDANLQGYILAINKIKQAVPDKDRKNRHPSYPG
jgi:hypothetical protein